MSMNANRKTLARLGAVIVLLASMTTPAELRADCAGTSVRDKKRDATMVFDGVVTKIERLDTGEYTATLKVGRVWKGPVADQQTVYFAQEAFDGPQFREGTVALVFTIRATSESFPETMRRTAGISAGAPLRSVWVPACWGSGSVVRDGDFQETVKQLGRSHRPIPAEKKHP
jgi:hypothetical protein